MLHALTSVKLSQLMDKNHWDFRNLEKQQVFSTEPTEELDADVIQSELAF
jgi:hypothetical protein